MDDSQKKLKIEFKKIKRDQLDQKKILGCSNIQFPDIQYSMKGRSGARGALPREHGPTHEVRVIGREEGKDLSDAFRISEAGARG